jgi:hypothetical protein
LQSRSLSLQSCSPSEVGVFAESDWRINYVGMSWSPGDGLCSEPITSQSGCFCNVL